MSKRLLVFATTAALMFGVAACGGSDGEGNGGSTDADVASEQEGAAVEPDLAGIPEVVAEVNGEEIPKEEFVSVYEGQFQQMAMQAEQSGQELDQEALKSQTAEQMVDIEILIQEADQRGFDATDSQVDETLDELAVQNGLDSPQELMQALEEQGMDEEAVMSQLRSQIKVDQLLIDEAGDVSPTQKELRDLYQEAKAQQEQLGAQGGEVPSFSEVKPQLEDQVQSQKKSEVGLELVETLREDAEVNIFL